MNRLVTITALSALAGPAMAAETGVAVAPGEEIVVTARPSAADPFSVLQSTTVLTAESLQLRLEGSIGETLASLPGFSSSFFGPGASRPIIRGLDGDRIRVLTNGIGSIDASTVSPDHAVAADPLGAQRIEVVRGPANLMYGSNAVGGVVNLLDGRISERLPADPVSGQVDVLYGSAADERAGAAHVDVTMGKFVLHLKGFYRESDDYRVPLGALKDDHDEDEYEYGEHEEEEENPRRVANSANRSQGATAGLSYVWDDGFLGLAYSRLDSKYGIPSGGHAHEEDEHHDDEHEDEDEEAGHGEENVAVDLVQDRLDIAGEVRGDLLAFEAARVRFGYADYQHVEIEGDEIGTIFGNKAWEGRLELVHKPLFDGIWRGASGVQLTSRDFEAIGDEAFVPPSETFNWGLFTFQEVKLGAVTVELGARFENQRVEALGERRTFDSLNVSGGLAWTPDEDWLLGVTISRSRRAPTAEELFADGAHLAIGAYEIGDPGLRQETAVNVEAFLRKRAGVVTGSISGFVTWYDDFITQAFTGGEMDGLPVLLRGQTNARFVGLEAEVEVKAVQTDLWSLTFDASADYVRATDTISGGTLPRIPPFRLQLGAEYRRDWLTGRVEVQRLSRQDRVAAFEEETEGYTMLNASLSVRPFTARPDVTIMLRGRNLTNAIARAYTSFLKEFAPLPGRDIRVSLQVGF
ncbi:TonB-dependent receptor [Emcibacter sp. SYSU 3D8]|uniref:TonB-dependent receptor n=1 Tax=Emcibacter sp. SYSU 3D8 TaxID=3133969 RepID=UPI0031FE5DE4